MKTAKSGIEKNDMWLDNAAEGKVRQRQRQLQVRSTEKRLKKLYMGMIT